MIELSLCLVVALICWYKLTLCKIATADDQANPMHLKQLAQAALDGEPTTADKHNKNIIKKENEK